MRTLSSQAVLAAFFLLLFLALGGCGAHAAAAGEAAAEHHAKLALPEGLAPVAGCATDKGTGLPTRVRCRKDDAEMILIPGGEFRYGPDGKRIVEIPFYIDRFPVTNERFGRFVRATGHKPGRCICGCCRLGTGAHASKRWTGIRKPAGSPAVNVTWIDAIAYCRWAGKELPTEMRWEKAARGTDGRRYPWGNEPKDGVFTGAATPHPVGKGPQTASSYGVEDMLGNAWELTVGWHSHGYHFEPNENQHLIEPKATGAGPPEGMEPMPVLRGGREATLAGQRTELRREVWRRLPYVDLIAWGPCSEDCLQGHGTGQDSIGFRCVVVPRPVRRTGAE